ncbi:MAG: hypothetical protein FWE45_01415 [Firmicutes bacterium]|nr:hypothetical protein [Bacillota bacterium]
MDKQLEIMRIKEMSKELGEIAEKLLTGFRTPIETLNLSGRAKNSLMRGGIEYVEQLIKLERRDILRLRNMGEKTFGEIKQKISEMGFNCLG